MDRMKQGSDISSGSQIVTAKIHPTSVSDTREEESERAKR